jgi:histidyl-tRNA synthetase
MPGVMELLPREQIALQRVLDAIRRNYERFGFLPIETPAIELSEMLLTKTGGETERQVYFVQSTGALEKSGDGVPELALRFDLTVPLARYVAEHEHDLAFPFRRYQIQRVYRGERAQRGRFREFYQADIDVIGKDNLSIRFDAEIPAVIFAVFTDLAIGPFTIHINNRKLMRGFLEGLGVADAEQQAGVLREVDKLDKRGVEHVRASLTGDAFGLSGDVADRILAFVRIRSNGHQDALDKLAALGSGEAHGSASVAGAGSAGATSETFNTGLSELRDVLELVRGLGVPESHYAINLSIARGLDYYTGTVFETMLNEHPQIGSICSGGRYDDLASNYTKSKLPGVGISIGVTRLFYQLQEAGLLDAAESSVQALVGLLDEARLHDGLQIARELRAGGINTEVQLESRKLARQMQYADRAGIRFVVLVGEDEAARGVVTVKDMRRGEQFEVARAELASALRVEIEQSRAMNHRGDA